MSGLEQHSSYQNASYGNKSDRESSINIANNQNNIDTFRNIPAEDDDDLLSPLAGPTRKTRGRVDSMSSMGSSVAPAALPQHRSRRHGSARPRSRDESFSNGAGRTQVPEIQLASHDSIQSGLSEQFDEKPMSIGEGGLEAWLRTQARAGPPNGTSSATNGRFQGISQDVIRRVDSRPEMHDGMSDAGKSTGAKSTGLRGSKRSTGTTGKRSKIPDWDLAAVDADAAGITSSASRKNNEMTGKGLREWLESAEVDSQVASERRRTRRELSPGTMSASGVRLREGVRRRDRNSSNGIGDGGMSIDGVIHSAREPSSSQHQPRSGTLSASPSMTGTGVSLLAASNAISARQTSTSHRSTSLAARHLKKEIILGSPIRTWAKSMLLERNSPGAKNETGSSATMAITVISAVLISTLLKWTTGLHGWSGKGIGPVYGDFEAQRHWIEITLHLPTSQWYFYDLTYWGLDYPPLTAKVSKWCGQAASYFPRVAEHFALDKSRGSEADEVALFMRATVLVLDTLLYVPAILFFLNRRLQGRGRRTRAIAILTVLLQPSILLIDHGHFQYNTVMLGLSAFAFALLYTSLPNPDLGIGSSELRNRMKSLSRRISYEYIAAAVFFSLSLSFKQMALYYAPAVFAIMLGRCVGLARIGFERGLICFTGIGLATIITFAIVFREWLGDINQIGQIIHRIFPMARGLFEDKVSNIWCFATVLPLPAKYKLRNAFSIDSLARFSLATTLLVILLPCAHLFAAAAETVHIEMFLDEDSKRQVLASEKRQKEGSIVGGSSISGRRPRHLSQAVPAPSEAGSNLDSILGSTTHSAVGGQAPSRLTPSPSTSRIVPTTTNAQTVASSSPSPAASVLPYALLSTSLAFFLFGFQTHEKSILIPLLPMTLLISVKADEWGGGAGKTDWEWAILMNNVSLFSMWPLLRRDGLVWQYALLSVGWNWAIGYRPFNGLQSYRKTFVAWSAAMIHLVMLALHFSEIILPHLPSIAKPIFSRYPDIFPVLNVLLCTPVFCLIWLWSTKRQLEVGFASGIDIFGLQKSNTKKKTTK